MSSVSFDQFFADVHGYAPFPWQSRLASRVVDEGRWPDVLDLPTGSGKTSSIDVALYALARRPDIFPRRIVLVVDRRVVVDQGAEHARLLLESMKRTLDGPAAEIASGLRSVFSGGNTDDPFEIAVLRGGMPRDESWAKYPDRPLVALSTVDQVGSRLLFRGYGVSPRMAPIHAGLLGNDTLLLLDEVQLSTAFAETLRALGKRWMRWHAGSGHHALPYRWAAVRMSATPIGEMIENEKRFTIDEQDLAHPVLSERLNARKLASLKPVRVTGKGAQPLEEFAKTCADTARDHLKRGAMTLAVIVNRVDSARGIFRQLHASLAEKCEVVLLTGRMRALDRDALLGNPKDQGSLIARLTSGRDRSVQTLPLVVVSTQSLEAGADFDFDALVTECASLDALRQRFGRLDRRGELATTEATILIRHDQTGETYDDPIYGGALAATWKWLSGIAASSGNGVDFGILQLPELPSGDGEAAQLCSPVIHSPVLLPAHIDTWAQTNPRPRPDPEVSLWLHGPTRGIPDVQIVWRADIRESDLEDISNDPSENQNEELAAQLEACPPSSLEAISVPLYAARAWLEGSSADPFGDVEGEATTESETSRDSEQTRRHRPCIRYRRDAVSVLSSPSGISPGDTIVVPVSYGGIAAGNWDPRATDPVRDLGDWAQLRHRGVPVVRLVPDVLRDWLESPTANEASATGSTNRQPPVLDVPTVSDAELSGEDIRAMVRDFLPTLRDSAGKELRVLLDLVLEGHRVIVMRNDVTLVGRRNPIVAKRLAAGVAPEQIVTDIITEDDDSSSFIGTALTLSAHLNDVRDKTMEFARNLGFPSRVVEDLGLAALLHDVGKADPRFQQMLLGGSEIRTALQRDLLAKSSGEMRDAAARERARKRSKYPDGYRHEILSVAMLERATIPAHDRDLVLHLVGSHHGWCRPFAPAVDPGPSLAVVLELNDLSLSADCAHNLARLDSGVAERFFDLTNRYGWWGLAWMEAVMRLADHRASEISETKGAQPPLTDRVLRDAREARVQ